MKPMFVFEENPKQLPNSFVFVVVKNELECPKRSNCIIAERVEQALAYLATVRDEFHATPAFVVYRNREFCDKGKKYGFSCVYVEDLV